MPARERAIGPAVSRRAGRNIQQERLSRNWTLTEMSFRLTEAGYRMAPVTIRQAEKGYTDGRKSRNRLLTVDELVAFSEVLEVAVTVLLYRETEWESIPGSAGSGGSSLS